MSPKKPKIDRLMLQSFLFLFSALVFIHLVIFYKDFDFTRRNLSYLSIGIGYDLLIAAEFSLLAYLFNSFGRSAYKLALIICGLSVFIFSFGDYLYYLNFSTHVPFSNVEYTGSFKTFLPSLWNALGSSYMLILLAVSSAFIFLVVKFPRQIGLNLRGKFLNFLALIFLGAIGGSYSNSVVYKNIENPIVSNSFWYVLHTYTNNKGVENKIKLPKESFSFLKENWNQHHNVSNSNFISLKKLSNCTNAEDSLLKESLCVDKPNILLILLESFRGDDVGVLGSKLGITPNFDHFSKEGILFTNFYANGFQTRHGLIASYCSLFPNYGPAILSSYQNNKLLCLPQALKEKGYESLWAHGSDAAFDNQLNFIPKAGFDRFFDIHNFPITEEKIGWGISDESLFQKWLVELDTMKEPFFSSSLTISNHHPFTVPKDFEKFPLSDQRFRFYNGMFYSDHALGRFLNEAKTKDWYKNTLIFVTADTSSHLAGHEKINNIKQKVQLNARIPLLILGGPVKKHATIDNFHSQVDIAPTLVDILGLREDLPFVGTSLLATNEDSLAFTNWPGSYWGVMSKKASYFRSSDKKEHHFGDEKFMAYFKRLSESLIDVSKWAYQNDLITSSTE